MSPDRKGRPEACRDWWRELQREWPNGETNHQADPGALARLRRASSPMEAAQEMQTIALYRRLHGAKFNEQKLAATAVVAAVLAHIRKNTADEDSDDRGKSTAELLGRGDPPVMSPLRMRRLTSARDARETLRGFREAVALLKGRAPVADVAISILDWLDDFQADRRKTRWLYAYHGASIADPTRSEAPANTGA